MKIKTKDIWLGCYCLSKGAELDEVRIDNNNGNHKKEVIFTFRGDEVNQLQKEFTSGQAECNVSRIRAGMIHLKEQMYELLHA